MLELFVGLMAAPVLLLVLVGVAVILVLTEASEAPGFALFSFAVVTAVLFLFFNINLPLLAYQNQWAAVQYVGSYLLAGLATMFINWWLINRDNIRDWKKFVTDNPSANVSKDDFMPNLGHYYGALGASFLLWWATWLRWLFGRFITKFTRLVIDACRGVLVAIQNYVWRNV